MKKQLLFIAIAGLFTSMASATDLYVRDAGAGGAYPTISAAITAAADGDRIIIRPKAAGLPYIESLTINKSLSFVSETNFTKYLVQGSVTITAAVGRLVTVNNINLTSTFSLNGPTTGGRTTVNLMNSTIGGNVYANFMNTTLNVSGCNVGSNYIYLSHGKCTANTAAMIEVSFNTGTTDTSPATDDVEIIANYITYRIYNNQTMYKFKMYNNFLYLANFYIRQIKAGTISEIMNNTVRFAASTSGACVDVGLINASTGVVSIMNNILTSGSVSSSYEIANDGSATGTIYASNNMSDSGFSINGATALSSNNVGSATMTFDYVTLMTTGANVNAGAIEDDYADIDLTRNDIGNYGGSDSWANYWPTAVGNKPQVNYLLTPRRIYTGTTEMNATGSGYSK